MNNSNSFNDFAYDLFQILTEKGYFDFDANCSLNEKTIFLITHKNYYKYEIWLRCDKETISNESIQLAYLISLENFAEIDIPSKELSNNEIIHSFAVSGFSNIIINTPQNSLIISGIFESNRITIKIIYSDISEQISFAKKHSLQEAINTGVYKGIDPRYKTKEKEEKNLQKFNYDEMDGYSFETYCAELLSKNGFRNVKVTKASGDQGIDILAEKHDLKYGIQCKCYQSDIGNKAVMETYAGISYYKCDIGIVLSNRFYTRAAKELSQKTGVILWDRNKLNSLIEKSNTT